MRYSARQYAEALHKALEEKKGGERAEALTRFAALIRRNGDKSLLERILIQYERIDLEKSGTVKAEVETPEALAPHVRREIEKAIGKPVMLMEKSDPSLIAGIRILLNDTLRIDASARTMIAGLFSPRK
ncbi:MAG TPA: F0F1 ATP synthase subunit delta [Candidatus Paceibacterota bacterium]|jgi:F0F1-type ATP synthase delta subunit|nr:F0F1 ATP synthase subunit delta [Candidatus Paceibacterota bacterium]